MAGAPQTLDSSQIVVSLESNDDFIRVKLFRGNAFQQFFALKGALDLWSLLPAAAGVLRTKGALDLWSLLPAAAGVLRTKGKAAKPSGRSGIADYFDEPSSNHRRAFLEPSSSLPRAFFEPSTSLPR